MNPRNSLQPISRRVLLHRLVVGAGAYAAGPYILGSARAQAAAAVAATPPSLPTPSDKVVATTTYGKVRGYLDQDIRAFKGIPYGDDTAKVRFKAPLPPPA